MNSGLAHYNNKLTDATIYAEMNIWRLLFVRIPAQPWLTV